VLLQQARDLVGDQPANPRLVFIFDGHALGDGIALPAGAARRKGPRLVGHLVLVTPVGLGNLERLEQARHGPALGRAFKGIGPECTAIRNDEKRGIHINIASRLPRRVRACPPKSPSGWALAGWGTRMRLSRRQPAGDAAATTICRVFGRICRPVKTILNAV
jgi:hypothetical protein